MSLTPASITRWKSEPVSPLVHEEAHQEDATLYAIVDDVSGTKFEIACKLLDDLEQLDNLDEFIREEDVDANWIKDEPFSNWLEEKILPPSMLDELCFGPQKYSPPPDTPSLLLEFENVLDAVEMARGTLTPPQSPPYESRGRVLTDLEPSYYQTTQDANVAQELAIVDELIRTRVQDLVSYHERVRSPSSPSSVASTFGDCSDDPEWIPETVEESSVAGEKTIRKRSKPYSRAPPEEKKIRKKEQNKNAATRYRMKKKAEVEVVLEEERALMAKRDGLEEKTCELVREIKYLKGLMRDMFRAKGLIV